MELRVTIWLDEKLYEKLCQRQVKAVEEKNMFISFSSVVNDLLNDCLNEKV